MAAGVDRRNGLVNGDYKMKLFKRKRKVVNTQGTTEWKKVVCSGCNTVTYTSTPRKCWGCDADLCLRCVNYRALKDKGQSEMTTWCDDCYETMNFGSRRAQKKISKRRRKNRLAERVNSLNFWPTRTESQRVIPRVAYVIPQNIKDFNAVPQTEDFFPNVSDDAFWPMIGHLMEHPNLEIAGVAVWDEPTNEIVWTGMDKDAEKLPGHVSSSSGELIVEALLAGHDVPNVQWHTHPGFSAYFSGEDTNDQRLTVEAAMKVNPTGYHIFIVFDRLTWRVVRIDWKDEKIVSKRNGYAHAHGVKLHFDKGFYSGWSFGQLAKSVDNESNGVVKNLPLQGYTSLGKSSFVRGENGVYTPVPYELEDLSYGDNLPLSYMIDDDDAEEDYFLSKGRYVGNWSDKDEDYADLFDRIGSPFGDWPQLYDDIVKVYGTNSYRSIVEHQAGWNLIPHHNTEVIRWQPTNLDSQDSRI